MNNTSAQIEKVHALLRSFSTGILITHDSLGTLHARPMAVAAVTGTCELWFITNDTSAKVHELSSDTQVHVAYQRDHSVYLSVSGKASVVHDSARIAELWTEPFRVWFPKGKTDPHLALIHVIPDRVEYWDNHGLNKASYLWEAALAYVSRDTPRALEGEEHGVVRLS